MTALLSRRRPDAPRQHGKKVVPRHLLRHLLGQGIKKGGEALQVIAQTIEPAHHIGAEHEARRIAADQLHPRGVRLALRVQQVRPEHAPGQVDVQVGDSSSMRRTVGRRKTSFV
jgi:hypothetical protein